VLAHLCVCLTIMGVPFHRIYSNGSWSIIDSTLLDRRERRQNYVRFMDSMHFAEAGPKHRTPIVLCFFYRRYKELSGLLANEAYQPLVKS